MEMSTSVVPSVQIASSSTVRTRHSMSRSTSMSHSSSKQHHCRKRKRRSDNGLHRDGTYDAVTRSIVADAELSLQHWNRVVAPQTNDDLTTRVDTRLHPLIAYLKGSMPGISPSTSASVSTTIMSDTTHRPTLMKQTPVVDSTDVGLVTPSTTFQGRDPNVTLPVLIAAATVNDMFGWLKNYGAALMLVRTASAAAGVYGQLTVNRLSQLTGVSVGDITTIEKTDQRVADTMDVQLKRIADYIMSTDHTWTKEPSIEVLISVLRHKMGFVLGRQMHNTQHEKRQLCIIASVLEGLTLNDGHVLTEFVPTRYTQASSPHLVRSTSSTTMFSLTPYQWAREVPVVTSAAALTSVSTDKPTTTTSHPTRGSDGSGTDAGMAMDRRMNMQSLTTIQNAVDDEHQDCQRNTAEDVRVNRWSAGQDTQQLATATTTSTLPPVQSTITTTTTTSKTVSADAVVRLHDRLWMVIEAKFLSDRSNVHNKTPRMIEAKRQCETHCPPGSKIIYVAFLGGDWDVTQLLTLHKEGFVLVWEHEPHKLQHVITSTYVSEQKTQHGHPPHRRLRSNDDDSDMMLDDDADKGTLVNDHVKTESMETYDHDDHPHYESRPLRKRRKYREPT